MADPVVTITNGVPTSSSPTTGTITTLGMTLVDGANATLGATTDTAVAAGAAGSINAHLRSISRDIAGGVVIQAGANTIGAVTQAGAPWSVSGTVSISGTVTVTGTVTANQGGTWNIGNISGTISLPTGAATSAKQPALGTAGTPSTDVITVQGAASMTPLKVDGSGVTQPISGNVGITGNVNCVQVTSPWVTSVSGSVTCVQSGNWTSRCVGNAGGIFDFASTQNVATPGQAILVGAEFNAVPTTITTGNSSPLQLDSAANLLTNIKASINLPTQGDTASGSTDAGNPVKIGGLAKTANPTAVTDGQRVAALFDKLGKQVVVGAIRTLKGVQKTSITSTTETTVVTAGAAGVFQDVYSFVVTNKSATAVFVDFRDSTAGTVRMTLAAPAGDTRGFTVPVDSAMPQASAANNWTATVSAAVTSIEISALYVSNT
jgi:hypothetical protein